ncbi:glyceraldehyde-3-phosphate dehydrogenase [Litorimonas cladophorae]|jgi:glyceraldehyde 3-phosphate dehydrogenase|uniref:Glyceraldehyde-3-phosphate dehydrogenase n=1 Tax=Litorimonas cladophorae TaxID=1220491 RepID=A0A918NGB4_9PROT|nr:type I glyceraldehyde-3-phosphate dehydrogenase [Litorimonas cladophorae]GGX64898.1 glyceraldehyde-3-phosphate dehydrogenase [Litorimonas cladophorae]
MTTRLAINGFGRIGRNVLRALIEQGREDLQVVAINDLSSTENLAHLLKYDSVHGRFPGTITFSENSLNLGGEDIQVTAIRNLEDQNWADNKVDIVLECTGIFTARDAAAKHIAAGAKRVLISAPGKGADKTIVFGVNHDTLGADDIVVSNGSCTTNALAPVAKVLNDIVGIEKGFMTTVHSYTGDQPTLDGVHRKDFNRGRAAALSMIPTSTGAAAAIGLVMPELEGKLDGKAIRVPTPNVSVVDLVINSNKTADVDAINAAFRAAAEGPLKGVLQVVTDKTVSIDFNHDPHSTSLVLEETVVMGENMVRVLSWYDNEWGFSNRMLDTAAVMAKFL